MDTLGSDATRYTRLLSFEAESLSDLASPDAERWQAFEQNVHAALSLLDTIDARLGEEVRALVIQVIGATPSSLNSGRSFGGASSLMLWGAILLNVNTHDSVVSVIAGLVHEAAHQLLFGLSLREPLVNNGIDERYNSPLRTDPRPMDGIFHATFVCARMHYAFARLLDQASTQFDREALDAIARHMHDERTGFIDGYETICRFGQITPTGKKIMDEASAYMQGVER
jgi:HEXXH motif-containing protein